MPCVCCGHNIEWHLESSGRVWLVRDLIGWMCSKTTGAAVLSVGTVEVTSRVTEGLRLGQAATRMAIARAEGGYWVAGNPWPQCIEYRKR